MLRSVIAFGAFWLSYPASAQQAPQLPGWMAGCWEELNGDRWTEECWTSPRAGMMMGSGRSGRGDTVREWEAMQIIAANPDTNGVGMTFWAAPGGNGRTQFTWDPSDKSGATFVNIAHDYPQRIRFWREGEELLAEISLANGEKPMRWRFKRLGR